MRDVSGKSYGEKSKKIHFTFNIFFFPEDCAVYELMWKNVVEADRPQMKV